MPPKKTIAFVEVTITPGGTLDEPDFFECHSGCKVWFVITNNDPINPYWVGLNTADTIYLGDYDPAPPAPIQKHNPFATGGPQPHSVQLAPGDTKIIQLQLKAHGSFGPALLQYTAYKYTLISADNQQLTTNPNPLDPGFVITPP